MYVKHQQDRNLWVYALGLVKVLCMGDPTLILRIYTLYIHFEIQIKQNKNVLCRILMWIYHSE